MGTAREGLVAPTGERPRQRICGMKKPSCLAKAGELEPEPMNVEARRPQLLYDLRSLVHRLAAADRTNPNHRFCEKADTGRFVKPPVGHVITKLPALKDGDDQWLPCLQIEKVLSRESLVIRNALSCALQHERLAHPVLAGSPVEVAYSRCPLVHFREVGVRRSPPLPIEREFAEPTGVQCPLPEGRREGLPAS